MNTKHLGWVGGTFGSYEMKSTTESNLKFLVRSREFFQAFQALRAWELMDDMDVDPEVPQRNQ